MNTPMNLSIAANRSSTLYPARNATAKGEFQSVKLLFRYATSKPNDNALLRVTTVLADGPLRINEIIRIANLDLVDVYTLIALRHLCFNWALPLSHETVISLPNQPFEGLKLENILRSTRYGPLLEQLAMGRRPADQQLLANAASWRQYRRPNGVFSNVGGIQGAKSMHPL